AAVEGVLNGGAPAAGLKVDEVRHVGGGDLEAKCVTFDRGAIDELIGSPHGRHGGHLVDDDLGRRRITQHRQQGSSWIIAAAFVDTGFAAFGNEVEDYICGRCFLAADLKPAVAACCCLRKLPGFSCTGSPQRDGGICKWTTARLDLPLDTNGGLLLRESLCARRRDADKPRKQTDLDDPDSAHGPSLTIGSAENSLHPPGIARQRA